jgi:hypothetical protein
MSNALSPIFLMLHCKMGRCAAKTVSAITRLFSDFVAPRIEREPRPTVASLILFQFNDMITLKKELPSVAKVLEAVLRALNDRCVVVWKNQLGLPIDHYPWLSLAFG